MFFGFNPYTRYPPNHPLLIGCSMINHPFWGIAILGTPCLTFFSSPQLWPFTSSSRQYTWPHKNGSWSHEITIEITGKEPELPIFLWFHIVSYYHLCIYIYIYLPDRKWYYLKINDKWYMMLIWYIIINIQSSIINTLAHSSPYFWAYPEVFQGPHRFVSPCKASDIDAVDLEGEVEGGGAGAGSCPDGETKTHVGLWYWYGTLILREMWVGIS